MPYEFGCAGCRTVLSLPSHIPGAVVTCPQCGTKMQLPTVLPPLVQPVPVAQPATSVAYPMPADDEPPVLSLKTDDLADLRDPGFLRGRPKRKRASGGMARLIGAFMVAGVIVAIGVGLVFAKRKGGLENIWRRWTRPIGAAGIEPDRPAEVGRNPMLKGLEPEAPIRVRLFRVNSGVVYESGFTITCISHENIRVKNVTFNSDFRPMLVDLILNTKMMLSEEKYPVNLTIGESIQVGWHYLHPDDPATYRKDVIYLDVLTDRGTFRFDKEGNLLGFDPPKPPTLEEQVFADGEQRWQEAKRAASTKLPKRAAQYLREQKREIVTALSKKYGLTEDQVRAIVLP